MNPCESNRLAEQLAATDRLRQQIAATIPGTKELTAAAPDESDPQPALPTPPAAGTIIPPLEIPAAEMPISITLTPHAMRAVSRAICLLRQPRAIIRPAAYGPMETLHTDADTLLRILTSLDTSAMHLLAAFTSRSAHPSGDIWTDFRGILAALTALLKVTGAIIPMR